MRLLLQLFIALCKALYERDQYLLTRLKGPFHSISELAGYFVLESGTVNRCTLFDKCCQIQLFILCYIPSLPLQDG